MLVFSLLHRGLKCKQGYSGMPMETLHSWVVVRKHLQLCSAPERSGRAGACQAEGWGALLNLLEQSGKGASTDTSQKEALKGGKQAWFLTRPQMLAEMLLQ